MPKFLCKKAHSVLLRMLPDLLVLIFLIFVTCNKHAKQVKMKFSIFVLLGLAASLSSRSQSVAEYVDYMQQKGMDPKEYIFEAFKKHDVVILGERDHRDTTQYEFILDLLADPRFAQEIGYVYTEVGVINQRENANRLIKGNFATHEDFYAAYIKFARDMDYSIWACYNNYQFVRGLYEINRRLPEDRKITWGLTDVAWDWYKGTYDSGKGCDSLINEYALGHLEKEMDRDHVMAENFRKMYLEQPKRNGKRKALLITNQPHSVDFKKDTREGMYLKRWFGKNRVKIVLMNWYDIYSEPEKGVLYADGAWDAAFERRGCKPVAVDFKRSPFGKVIDSYYGRWSDVADGMIFYTPFYKLKPVYGIPGLISADFIEEYRRRMRILTGWIVLDEELKEMQDYYNITRTEPRCRIEEQQMEQLQKKMTE